MGEKHRVIKLTMNFTSNEATYILLIFFFNNRCQFQLENGHEDTELKKKKKGKGNDSLPLIVIKMWSACTSRNSGGNTV